ncbi:MAG: flagellar export protein FliJ [Firmicutes bacterium HGW-Firmicutes-1]|jgi:flagellar FliJ protein|nr:MAG: flagellar export protein FliJ [Firmicutes bacterium HGW-Firmicutes-1]
MGRFTFKLQNVLGIKEKIEEQKKIELGNAMIYLAKQEEIFSAHKDALNLHIQTFNEKNGKSVLAKELIELNGYIKYYKDAIQFQKNIINEAKEMVEMKREALNKALIEKKTYEKLKELALENHLLEEQAQNNKQTDELNSYNQLIKSTTQ